MRPMKDFFFTLTTRHIEHHWPGRRLSGGCVKVSAPDASVARERMAENFGVKWSFQYDDIEKVHPLDREILQELTAL